MNTAQDARLAEKQGPGVPLVTEVVAEEGFLREILNFRENGLRIRVERRVEEARSLPEVVINIIEPPAVMSAETAKRMETESAVGVGVSVVQHIVVRGDTLWFIAKKYLGDPYRYPQLVELSKIRNPDLIYPGDFVTIEF